MTRFCANLNLDISVQQLANTVARRALNLNLVSGRSPVSVAAAAIYMAALALGCRKEKKGEPLQLSTPFHKLLKKVVGFWRRATDVLKIFH